jgi:DNA-binding MarR family transcriptional regulator
MDSVHAMPCACASLRRASRAVCHLYDLVLAPARINAGQFMILRSIAERGEVAQCDLAIEFAASIETMSRRLAGLRRLGLTVMHHGPHHKRIYSVTAKGQQRLDEAMPYWEAAQMRLQRMLEETDWRQIFALSERLTAAAIQAETKPLTNGHARVPMNDARSRAAATLQISAVSA